MEITSGITIGGKYVVERPLARGGMGAVWVARHVKLGSPVAIKFLDAHLAAAPALVARFEREARAAANLDTPHVVHVHDYGVEEGTPYLVMELLRGEDLNTRLHHRHRLSLPEAAKIVSQMGRALRRAHEAGIVHRDLKPANVFIARSEDEEVVKVLDFGIAKETWSRVEDSTKTGEVFGSPHYMSPEQARAQKTVDHRADVWATGAMIYRMVTGRLPFPGEVLGEVLSSVLVDPFPPIAEAAPDLPPELDVFFTKALAKRKEERYSTIGQLVDAFAAIAGSEPARTSQAQIPAASATSPTLDPAAPPAVAPQLAACTVDTVAATQVLVNLHAPVAAIAAPMAPAIPIPAMEAQSSVERTGPSIANATTSVLPLRAGPRKARTMWPAFGAAICVVAAVGVAVVLMVSGQPNESAKVGPASTPSVAVTVPLEPPPAEAPMKSVEPLPAEPTKSAEPIPLTTGKAPPLSATASSSASAILMEVPTAKPEPSSTSKPATPAATLKPAAATTGAPVAKPAMKKPTPDWGL